MLEIKHLSSAGIFDIIHIHVHEQALGWFSFTFGLVVNVVDNEPSKLSYMTVTVSSILNSFAMCNCCPNKLAVIAEC